jgi:hypothetical protein
MKCEVCGMGPVSGTSLYRINPKGEFGRWRCMVHRIPSDDVEILQIVAELERKGGAETNDAAKGEIIKRKRLATTDAEQQW